MNIKKTIKKILKEEIDLPIFLKRRVRINEDVITDYLKKYAVRLFKHDTKINVIIKKACFNAAYDILSQHSLDDLDEDVLEEYENKLAYYLYEHYRDFVEDYINKFFDSSGDDRSVLYQFWKHKSRTGGDGFKTGFGTWNELLREYAWWFPDLNWEEIKKQVDDMPEKMAFLLKSPGDKNNTMNYYFSILRKEKQDNKLQTESIYLNRRLSRETLEENFEDALNYISEGYEENKLKSTPRNFDKFLTSVMTIFMDNLHPVLFSYMKVDFPYDEIYEYLQKKYYDRILQRYEELESNNNIRTETNESELTEKCWKGYTQKGMKTMFGKRYPNCVKKTK